MGSATTPVVLWAVASLLVSILSGAAGLIVFPAMMAYPIPGFVALARRHPNAQAIAALNMLLGWTVIGWAGALVWALLAVDKKP